MGLIEQLAAGRGDLGSEGDVEVRRRRVGRGRRWRGILNVDRFKAMMKMMVTWR